MPKSFQDIMNARCSVRAFRKAPVERSQMEAICQAARKAPSGANLQPGKFHVLTGDALAGLCASLQAAIAENRPFDSEYSYFPDPIPAELKARQRSAGFALYEALGIEKRDVAGRRAQFAKNYDFFDAPVGVVVTIQKDMGKGCFMDMGMAIMSFLLAAEDEGLGATGIGALANYASVAHAHLGLAEDEMVVCGIAVGHPDLDAPVNNFRTERAALEEFTSFRGFPDESSEDSTE
nr:nitroreductase [Cognatishimia activa]